MLTPRQSALYDYLKARQAASNVGPSFEEMRAAIGLQSKSGIARLVAGLEERGYVRRLPNHARSIEILR